MSQYQFAAGLQGAEAEAQGGGVKHRQYHQVRVKAAEAHAQRVAETGEVEGEVGGLHTLGAGGGAAGIEQLGAIAIANDDILDLAAVEAFDQPGEVGIRLTRFAIDHHLQLDVIQPLAARDGD